MRTISPNTRQMIRFLVLGIIFLAIFVPKGLLPRLDRTPVSFCSASPSPEAWIASAEKVVLPLEEMNIEELVYSSTALHIKGIIDIKLH